MKFLYIFGFEPPGEAERKQRNGWDDESSCAVVIEADAPDQALAWGRQVAEEFLRRLCRDAQASWANARYADEVGVPGDFDASGMEVVPVGVHPDYTRLLADVE